MSRLSLAEAGFFVPEIALNDFPYPIAFESK
jgi:hypothetical protein